jgi:hypothetical protein
MTIESKVIKKITSIWFRIKFIKPPEESISNQKPNAKKSVHSDSDRHLQRIGQFHSYRGFSRSVRSGIDRTERNNFSPGHSFGRFQRSQVMSHTELLLLQGDQRSHFDLVWTGHQQSIYWQVQNRLLKLLQFISLSHIAVNDRNNIERSAYR